MFFNENEIFIKSGDRLKITSESANALPFFTGIGISFQYIIFLQLGKKAREILLDLIAERDIKTNKTSYVVDPKNKSTISKAFLELKQHRIVCRVCKQTYLLNPDAIIPQKEYYEEIKQEWFNHGN